MRRKLFFALAIAYCVVVYIAAIYGVVHFFTAH
jgi:hypothetical protein